MKIVVLDGHVLNPGDLSWEPFRAFGELAVYQRCTPESILDCVGDAEILLTNKTPLSRHTISKLPKLRYIGVLATGFNIVDLEAARSLGIVVTNIPNYGTHSVAQFAFALLLELCHRVGLHDDAVRSGEWNRSQDWCFWKSPLVELAGQTFGIVGFGRIGSHAALIAQAFGMKVIVAGSDCSDKRNSGDFRWRKLEDLFAESDVISLHCPLTHETFQLVNSRTLAMMKPSALLLNTSRGALIDEQSLADALNNDRLAGAGLDVLSAEPPTPENPLLSAKNCVITPHVAWATFQARSRLMRAALENLSAFVSGRAINVVNWGKCFHS